MTGGKSYIRRHKYRNRGDLFYSFESISSNVTVAVYLRLGNIATPSPDNPLAQEF